MAEQEQRIRFYQVGSHVVGNRLLDPEQRTVQARMDRSNTLTCGHRACRGCGEARGELVSDRSPCAFATIELVV